MSYQCYDDNPKKIIRGFDVNVRIATLVILISHPFFFALSQIFASHPLFPFAINIFLHSLGDRNSNFQTAVAYKIIHTNLIT